MSILLILITLSIIQSKSSQSSRRLVELIEPTSSDGCQIPKIIYITYKSDLCDTKRPSSDFSTPEYYLALNVQRIKEYNPDFTIKCFDDEQAYEAIKYKDPELANYFKEETIGMYKSDIWRIVMLYHFGGFYFDADMEPISSFKKFVNCDTTFVSSIADDQETIFQSILGSTASNEILKYNLKILRDFYANNRTLPDNMGTKFLAAALRKVTNEDLLPTIQERKVYNGQRIQLFQEKKYDAEDAEEKLAERTSATSPFGRSLLPYAVYDPQSEKWIFWSRICQYENEYVVYQRRKFNVTLFIIFLCIGGLLYLFRWFYARHKDKVLKMQSFCLNQLRSFCKLN